MYKGILSFVIAKNILFQFGFRIKHSTTLAKVLKVNKIQYVIEDGNFSCGIY